jgi:hypothetical protein
MVSKEQASSEREPWVYLKINAAFAKEGVINPATNKAFNVVTCPPGTMLGVKDMGGYQFFPYEFKVDRYDARLVDIPCPPDKPIQLSKTQGSRDEAGKFQPKIGEDGKPVKDIVEVMPQALKSAFDKNFRDFKAAKAAEREAESLAKKTERAETAAKSKGNKTKGTAQSQKKEQTKQRI